MGVILAQNPQPSGSLNYLVESVMALALCHNVTPVQEGGDSSSHAHQSEEESEEEVLFQNEEENQGPKISYQASSPDEVSRANSETMQADIQPFAESSQPDTALSLL